MDGDGSARGSDVALLIDWENLKFSLAQRNLKPNVAALRSAAERFGRIVFARAYADWQDGAHRDEASGLYMLGLEPVYVPTRRYSEGTETRVKGSVDVKLTADCIEASHQYPHINTFVIVSGDHGFLHVVNTLRPRGKLVVVVGVSWSTARQLTEPADVVLYYDLDVDKPLSESGASGSADQSIIPVKVAPQVVRAAETVVDQSGGIEGGQDKREIADVLQVALTVVREFREASRDLSVSSLGQEMQKRMTSTVYAQQVKGKLAVLVQSLVANNLVRVTRIDLQDFVYLPDETLPEPSPNKEPTAIRLDLSQKIFTDLRQEERLAIIRAIHALKLSPHLDFLTFKRIQSAVAEALGQEEWDVHNLTNSMVSFNVIHVSGRRRATADAGYTYEFDTFALSEDNPEVKDALR